MPEQELQSGLVIVDKPAAVPDPPAVTDTSYVIAGLLFVLISLPFIRVANALERRALARQQQGAVV